MRILRALAAFLGPVAWILAVVATLHLTAPVPFAALRAAIVVAVAAALGAAYLRWVFDLGRQLESEPARGCLETLVFLNLRTPLRRRAWIVWMVLVAAIAAYAAARDPESPPPAVSRPAK